MVPYGNLDKRVARVCQHQLSFLLSKLCCLVCSKVKTRVVRKTLNPVFDETFTFYSVDANQLTGISLHFVVLSFDRFSRDDVIGEVVYQLEGMDVDSSSKSAVCVCRQIEHRHVKVCLSVCPRLLCCD